MSARKNTTRRFRSTCQCITTIDRRMIRSVIGVAALAAHLLRKGPPIKCGPRGSSRKLGSILNEQVGRLNDWFRLRESCL